MSLYSANGMIRRTANLAGYSLLLLDLTEAPSFDFTCTQAIEDIIVDSNNPDRAILLSGPRSPVREKT